MSSSNKRLRIAASALLVRERFLLAAAGRAGGRGEEAPTRLGGEVRSAEPGAMVQMAMGLRPPRRHPGADGEDGADGALAPAEVLDAARDLLSSAAARWR